jgi:hypothetical protein
VMASAWVLPLEPAAASELAPDRGDGLHTQRYLSLPIIKCNKKLCGLSVHCQH